MPHASLQRTVLVVVVLQVFYSEFLERQFHLSFAVFHNLFHVDILNRKVVVVEPEGTSDRLEVGLFDRRTECILVFDFTMDGGYRAVEKLDGVVSKRREHCW